jgi:hypothetical protein
MDVVRHGIAYAAHVVESEIVGNDAAPSVSTEFDGGSQVNLPGSAIDFPAVSNLNHEDSEPVVFDPRYDAVVAYAVLPELA